VISAVLLPIITFQIYFVGLNANRAAARQVFMSYSEATLRYPEFAAPSYEALKTKGGTEFTQYKSYVAHMLFAYDEVLKVDNDPEWRATFNNDITAHIKYLCDERSPELDAMFFTNMREPLGGS
jgi:hypothetical protein